MKKVKKHLIKGSIGILSILLVILIIALVIGAELGIPVFLTLLILKLCNVVTFSWFFVFLPLIISAGLMIIWCIIRVSVALHSHTWEV